MTRKLDASELSREDWANRTQERDMCACCGGRQGGIVWYPSLQWFLCLDHQIAYREARQRLRGRRVQVAALDSMITNLASECVEQAA